MTTRLSLRIDRHQDHVAELVLLGPGRGNAMCLIVRGSGDHFSYGLDLQGMISEMAPLLQDGAAGRARIVQQAAQMVSGFDALSEGRLPVIAAVDGWCIGSGVEMIAACDIRVATKAARFALREVKVGMVADLGGIARLPHLIGEGWSRELALTGDDIDAATAQRFGLVSHVLDDADAALEHARSQAARIAANPPLVVAGIKQVMNARLGGVVHGNREAATLNGMLMQSEDFDEAMRSFMEKREPHFSGR
jgi:enoyl-CoA hydratase